MDKRIKYTTDGKKVVVIGDLNQTEKIVQEIFVTENGDEIPQGERFLVKNLLDAPMKSWKEERLEKLEQEYNKLEKEWIAKIERVKLEKTNIYNSLSDRVNWLRGVAKTKDKDFKNAINTIADFLSNSEKWILIPRFKGWDLFEFNEDNCNEFIELHEIEYRKSFYYKSMRLISIYGKSNGDLSFGTSKYGNPNREYDEKVMFFRKREDAIKFMQDYIDKIDSYTDDVVSMIEKYKLNPCEDKFNAYKSKINAEIDRRIKEFQNSISLWEEKRIK